MSFCYACGHEMELEREDNIVVCGTCADSIKFEVRTKVFISASDVVRCVLCAETVSAKSSGKLYCSGPKCKFRIMSTDSEMVTDSLQKYATEGKVRFCYACGSSVIKEAGKYIHHSSESFGLTKNLTVLCDEQLVQSGRPSAAAKTASAGWFSWMRDLFSWRYTISPEIWQPEKQEATTGTSCTSSQEMKTTQNSMSITTSSKPSNKQTSREKITDIKEDARAVKAEIRDSKIQQPSKAVSFKPWKVAVNAIKRTLTSKMSRSVYQMVLIGETGSGKTSFFNLLCNFDKARVTYQLKYVLTEISATLPKTAFSNLIIIMTNSQDVTCANFDVRELPQFFGSEVVIKPERVFYIDNPYSKLEKCRQETKLVSHQQLVDALRMAFQIAGESLVKMLETIKDFSEIHTNCFAELYKVKQEVEKKMLHLLVAQQNKEELQKQILKAKEKLDAAASTKTLNENFTSSFKVKKVVIVETKRHNTICGAPHCNSNCHVPCNLAKTVDKENMKSCHCIDKRNDYKCTVCGHSYLDHFHSESVFEIREEETVDIDKERKKRFEDANTAQEECAKLKGEYDAKLEYCEENMKDLKVGLIDTLKTFETLGSSPSYEKVLVCQLYVVEQRIKVQQRGDDLRVLNATKDDLQKMLRIVQDATIEDGSGKMASKAMLMQDTSQVQPFTSNNKQIMYTRQHESGRNNQTLSTLQ
eukprot:Em0334g1a